MSSPLMDALLRGRPVYEVTQIQPTVGSVPQTKFKAHSIAGWSIASAMIHATREMLSAPVYGSTRPNEFISISGVPPKTPVVIHVPGTAGSNMPSGGMY